MRSFEQAGRREKGAVLLTVLLMLAAMSAVAVGMMEEIRFDIRRSVNLRLYDQALWFGLGGEAFALSVIKRADAATPGRATMLAPWAREPVILPLDNGVIEARIRDGGNCFNLNSVVRGEEGVFAPRETGIEQYIALLEALGFNDTERNSLAYSLADWIDSDGAQGPRGAEDYYYSGLTPPYRTAGVLLADVTELRAINGYTEAAYRAVRPYVCALPSDALSPLNVNTLRPEDAPLITMLVGEDVLAIESARQMISERDLDGYATIDEFWENEAFAGYEPDEDLVEQTGLQTMYFDVQMRVTLRDAFVAVNSLFERRNDGIVLVSRSYGLSE